MFSRAVAALGYKQWQESLALSVLFSEGVFIYFSATFKGSFFFFFTNFGILSIKTSGIKKKIISPSDCQTACQQGAELSFRRQ